MVRSICQMAYVTRSIDTCVDYWIDVMGAGSFFLSEIYCPEQQIYRGNPTEVRFRLACGYSGDIQIEIIQQENDARSPFIEIMKSRTRLPLARAFHHVQL